MRKYRRGRGRKNVLNQPPHEWRGVLELEVASQARRTMRTLGLGEEVEMEFSLGELDYLAELSQEKGRGKSKEHQAKLDSKTLGTGIFLIPQGSGFTRTVEKKVTYLECLEKAHRNKAAVAFKWLPLTIISETKALISLNRKCSGRCRGRCRIRGCFCIKGQCAP